MKNIQEQYNNGRRDFRGLDLRGVDLWNANLKQCDFSGVDFTGANLSRTALADCDFTGAKLTGVNLYMAVAFNTKFISCDLSGAYFNSAVLSSAIFIGADLSGTFLEGYPHELGPPREIDIRESEKDGKIRIGCKAKTMKNWDKFFKSKSVIETPRGTPKFQRIEDSYKCVRRHLLRGTDYKTYQKKTELKSVPDYMRKAYNARIDMLNNCNRINRMIDKYFDDEISIDFADSADSFVVLSKGQSIPIETVLANIEKSL